MVQKPATYVEKLWGSEVWIRNDAYYCMKILNLVRGFESSLHYHRSKIETFFVARGTVRVEINDRVEVLGEGGWVHIAPGTRHRFRALTEIATVVEASTMHDDADVVRIENSRRI